MYVCIHTHTYTHTHTHIDYMFKKACSGQCISENSYRIYRLIDLPSLKEALLLI